MNAKINKLTIGMAFIGLSLFTHADATDNTTITNHQITDPAITYTIATQPQFMIPNETITLVAVGDMMIGSSFPTKDFLPKDDAKHSFDAVLPFLQGDVIFGNLEGSLLDDGVSTKCPPTPSNAPTTPNTTQNVTLPKPANQKSTTPITTSAATTKSEASTPARTCYAFRMPERYGQIIKDAGFNLLSVANNHIGDFGDKGRITTLKTLDKVGIYSAGLQSKPTTIFEQNGVKYGFVAFAPNIGTVSINDIENAKKLVKDLDKKVDIVIVYMHGGGEGADNTHVPKTDEIYLNEKRGNVHAFAHTLIDNGADVVLGSGPHVTRALEVYKNKMIAYSLGNFNTYGTFNLKGPAGVSPILSLSLAKNGDFISATAISTKQTKEKGLQLDTTNQAFKELKALTASDFPDTPLEFKDNRITLKSSEFKPTTLPANSAKN